jgi:hypothetical protein
VTSSVINARLLYRTEPLPPATPNDKAAIRFAGLKLGTRG